MYRVERRTLAMRRSRFSGTGSRPLRRLELDYGPSRRFGLWLGIVALALAAIIGAKLADLYVTAKREAVQLEARIARNGAPRLPRPSAALPESVVREIQRANDVIEQIALPWDRLFRAVESAASEKVALLSITPDQKSGTVQVGGEAAGLGAMFDYVKRLQLQPSLTHVYLVNQKINEQDPQHPVRFTVTASWVEKPSAF